MRSLVALPVFNEASHVDAVLDEVRRYADQILVVDDGSSDNTPDILAKRDDVLVVRHEKNRGYGAALHTSFDYAAEHDFDAVVTIDCDGQHEPKRIPLFIDSLTNCDIVSGSRYLHTFANDSAPPVDRRRINQTITRELNQRLRLNLTDSFCGFKAYRVSSLKQLRLTETGYAMPLEFWVEAVAAKLRIRELPVPLIYLDEERLFGGDLDRAETRLAHYRTVFERSIKQAADRLPKHIVYRADELAPQLFRALDCHC